MYLVVDMYMLNLILPLTLRKCLVIDELLFEFQVDTVLRPRPTQISEVHVTDFME